MPTKQKTNKTVKSIDPIDGLRLNTLSGTYESARRVLNLIPMQVISTTDQLIIHMKKLIRQRESMFELLKALDQLDEASRRLGTTTLVAPVDHPLVVRHTLPRDVGGE